MYTLPFLLIAYPQEDTDNLGIFHSKQKWLPIETGTAFWQQVLWFYSHYHAEGLFPLKWSRGLNLNSMDIWLGSDPVLRGNLREIGWFPCVSEAVKYFVCKKRYCCWGEKKVLKKNFYFKPSPWIFTVFCSQCTCVRPIYISLFYILEQMEMAWKYLDYM